MTRGKLITAVAIAAFIIGFDGRQINAQTPQTPAVKGGVDMVRVTV